jgi:light-regulated signal transduction histidine kinase (bacteriophytochrome)
MKLARVSEEELEQEEVDLSLLARIIAAEKREFDPLRKVQIEIEEGMTAMGDTGLIRLVLENLMGNAWKFTAQRDNGHIFFGCWTDTAETVFFIRDNGAGFDMAQSDSLFKPFGRLHNSDEFAGTGIGLATVQRIVARHGGRIWAEGAPDAGATFYFTLKPKAGET